MRKADKVALLHPVNVIFIALTLFAINGVASAQALLQIPASVNLGILACDVAKVEVTLPVRTDIASGVKIISAKGACSCFIRSRMPTLLQPQVAQTMTFEFDIARFIDLGKWSTEVAISYASGDEKTKEATLLVRFSASFDVTGKLIFIPSRGSLSVVSGSEEISIAVFGSPFLRNKISVNSTQSDKLLIPNFVSEVQDIRRGNYVKLGDLHVKSTNMSHPGDWIQNVFLNTGIATEGVQSIPIEVIKLR